MKIQVNSDHNVTAPEGFSDYVRKVIDETLGHQQSQISRIEVHFSDENGGRPGADDKRCVMEARLNGRKPIAVTDQSNTIEDVIGSTAEKLKHALSSILGKEHDHHPRISSPKDDLDNYLDINQEQYAATK